MHRSSIPNGTVLFFIHILMYLLSGRMLIDALNVLVSEFSSLSSLIGKTTSCGKKESVGTYMHCI